MAATIASEDVETSGKGGKVCVCVHVYKCDGERERTVKILYLSYF